MNLICQIDANDDGWFHGFDNFQIRILIDGDSARVADYYLRDCSSWTNSPNDRRDILASVDLGLERITRTTTFGEKACQLTLRIPRSDKYGLALSAGIRLRLRFGVQSVADVSVWDELFERNAMMQVQLQ